MASNHSRTRGIPVTRETLSERMAAYDQLPPALRQVLDECPIEQSPIKTLAMWNKVGRDTRQAVFIFNMTVQANFPGYHPPRRRPRPRS